MHLNNTYKKLFALLISVLLWTNMSATAFPVKSTQTPEDLYTYYAAFTYHFAKFSSWETSTSGDFVIGVWGDSQVFNKFTPLASRTLGEGKRLKVKRVSSMDMIKDCQIIFIQKGNTSTMKSVFEIAKENNILVVTENTHSRYTCINFIFANESVKYEVRKANMKEVGVIPSESLLRFAIVLP